LTSLRPEVDKEKWIAHDIARGGLQAKIGAVGYSAQRTFQWLDLKFGIEREALRAKSDLGLLMNKLHSKSIIAEATSKESLKANSVKSDPIEASQLV